MITANIHDAKTHLSKLLEQACQGEEVFIARAGEPIVRLVPIQKPQKRKPGALKGKIEISADFEDLPHEFMQFFIEENE